MVFNIQPSRLIRLTLQTIIPSNSISTICTLLNYMINYYCVKMMSNLHTRDCNPENQSRRHKTYTGFSAALPDPVTLSSEKHMTPVCWKNTSVIG